VACFAVGAKKRHRGNFNGAAEVHLVVQLRESLHVGKRATGIFVGLLTMTPTGAGPRLFITSTVEPLKFGSGRSAVATMRIVVIAFASCAKTGHDIAQSNSSKPSRAMAASVSHPSRGRGPIPSGRRCRRGPTASA
jgi:hypothetical protein